MWTIARFAEGDPPRPGDGVSRRLASIRLREHQGPIDTTADHSLHPLHIPFSVLIIIVYYDFEICLLTSHILQFVILVCVNIITLQLGRLHGLENNDLEINQFENVDFASLFCHTFSTIISYALLMIFSFTIETFLNKYLPQYCISSVIKRIKCIKNLIGRLGVQITSGSPIKLFFLLK